MRNLLLVFLCFFVLKSQANLFEKVPQNYVNDYEDILTPMEEYKLNNMIKNYEDSTSIQIAVVTIDSIFSSELELKDFSDRLGEEWGVGSSELDNGLLVVISLASRKWSISIGYGLEPLYTDVMSKRIANESFISNFREEKYYEGIYKFLNLTMDEIGREGFEQLIEKNRIEKEERKKKSKEFLNNLLLIIGILAFVFFIIVVVVQIFKYYKKRKELDSKITFIHNEIIRFKEKLLKILGSIPNDIQNEYIKNTNIIKVNNDTYERLKYVLSLIKEHLSLINSTNRTISEIISEESELKSYLKNNYEYCEKYLKKELQSYLPDTNTDIFNSKEFTTQRLNLLRGINTKLDKKRSIFLQKVNTINNIVLTNKELDNKVEEFRSLYEEYKNNKKKLNNLAIGDRLKSIAKIDIEKYISDIKQASKDSYLSLQNNDYEKAAYQYGIYLTTVSVITNNFNSVSKLISSYNLHKRYISSNLDKMKNKISEIDSKIKKSGVKYNRKSDYSRIKLKIKKFNNNLEYDVILSGLLLEEILKLLESLYTNIKRDINNYSYSSSNLNSSSGSSSSSFGGFGGGSFGGGGSTGSW